jgi:hypothetical protein
MVMPCDSSVVNEQGNTFSNEVSYRLNYSVSRVFNYISKVRLWTDGTCAWKAKYPNFPDHMPDQNHLTTITNNFPYCSLYAYRIYYFR